MAIILPTAPSNFYEPSLNTLKNVLETAYNGYIGKIALITALPVDANAAWADVGVAGNSTLGTNRGNLVIGHASITTIGNIESDLIEATHETGYKITFAQINNVPVYIDGSGTTTTTVIGAALVQGLDLYANGTNAHVKYLIKINNLVVTDGVAIDIPEFSIAINYSKEAP